MAAKQYQLTIGIHQVFSTQPIDPDDIKGFPCTYQAFRLIVEREDAAGNDMSRLKPLLEIWKRNSALQLYQVVEILEAGEQT